MMKRKFGDSLRSKGDTSMVNEALRKILCHSLVVLIREMCELGIEPLFWFNGPFNKFTTRSERDFKYALSRGVVLPMYKLPRA